MWLLFLLLQLHSILLLLMFRNVCLIIQTSLICRIVPNITLCILQISHLLLFWWQIIWLILSIVDVMLSWCLTLLIEYDFFFVILVDNSEHILIIKIFDIVWVQILWNCYRFRSPKFKTSELYLSTFDCRRRTNNTWCPLCNIVNGIEVFHFEYQAIMGVVLGAIGQNLVTAFAFDEFSFSPEFGIELDDYVL